MPEKGWASDMVKRKTVLITGSSKGLGRSLAFSFAREGYNIILHGRDEKRLRNVQKDILFLVGNQGYCYIVIGDLMRGKTINELHKVAKTHDIDVLINNAGAYAGGSFEDIKIKEIERIITVNLVVPVLLIKKIYPIFLKKKSGLIINVNSVAGKNPNDKEAIYCSSKYGLRGFSDSFRFEAIKSNVKIISVYLGAMQTEITEQRADFNELMRTEEVADAIYFGVCENYESLKASEISLLRRIY